MIDAHKYMPGVPDVHLQFSGALEPRTKASVFMRRLLRYGKPLDDLTTGSGPVPASLSVVVPVLDPPRVPTLG